VGIAGPITVKDNICGSSQISFSDLAPGQSVERFDQYYVIPRELDAGFVINSTYATGSFNNKTVTSNSDTAIAKFFGPTYNPLKK
jgi:hypothetical protein